MALIETWLKQDLTAPVVVRRLAGNVFSADNQANLIGVEVVKNGAAENLSGSCVAYCIRADQKTVIVAGTVSGNTAYVTLPQACYAVVGQLSVVLKVDSVTLAAVTGYVYRTSTDTIVDPGTIIPSVDSLIEQIEEAVASIPPDYSALTEEVGNLSSALSSLPIDEYDMNVHFERDGSSLSRLKQTFKNRFIPFTMSVPDDTLFQMAVELYDSAGVLYAQSGWVTSFSVNKNAYSVIVTVRKSDSSNISTSAIIDFNNSFTVSISENIFTLLYSKSLFGEENFTANVIRQSNTRRAKCMLITAYTPIKVALDSNTYRFALYQFDKSGNQIYGSSWTNSIYVGKEAYSISIDFKRADDGVLSASNVIEINNLLNVSKFYAPERVFVSTSGNDVTGDGTKENPFATFDLALAIADNIIIEPGIYTQRIRVLNRDNVKICADGNVANDSDTVQINSSSIDNALLVDNCNGLVVDGIIFKNSSSHVANIQHSRGIVIQNCQFNNSVAGSGVAFIKADAIVVSCRADYNGNDGFNMHNCGDTVFINCTGNHNTGDGLSHHENCTGSVSGGYWENNGKAGISTPTYGANVQVSDAFCSGNKYGMQVYGGDDVTENTVHIKVSNVVFENNSTAGIEVDKYIVDLVNCIFKGNTADKLIVSGTVNEYNTTVISN